jgi:hypothetical protein
LETPISENYRTDSWDFECKFDFIHTRITAGCWSSFETQIAAQAFDALQPGGWFESQEIDCNIECDDGTLDASGPVVSWMTELILAAEKLDRSAIIGAKLKEIYERVGFVDIQQRVYKMPIGPWPRNTFLKQIGFLWRHNLLQGLSAFSYHLLHHAFQRSAAEIEVLLSHLNERMISCIELIESNCRSHWSMFGAISPIRKSTRICPRMWFGVANHTLARSEKYQWRRVEIHRCSVLYKYNTRGTCVLV